ncbi:MAG: molybdenum ABC transporter ATP-binding protein [Hyphomicrobiaceae bacterium]|nr:molybdenum ABC transporter ATP-binding protein [Hyphomicrobiaceae bacterium]
MHAEQTEQTLAFDVRLSFGAFTLDVADEVPLAGITALFGHSGSGKSTLLRILAGLEARAEGEVHLAGTTLQRRDGKGFVPPHARGIGVVFQDARLFPNLDVAGNLAYAERRSRTRDGRLDTAAVVEALDLEPLLKRHTATLSGGERQRVALGRTLLTRPRLVLMDEPLASIDGRRKRDILPYIERLPQSFAIPVVYVTHSIDEVAALADRILLVSEGRRVDSGPLAEMMSRLDLFPLTGRFEAGALVDCRIAGHDTRDQLTDLTFDGGQLAVPLLDLPVGSEFRLRIRARDVILASEMPGDLSANNIVAGVVMAMREDTGAFVDVQLACGGTTLLARVTHRAVRRLALAPGRPIYAIIKSSTIDRPVGPAPRR